MRPSIERANEQLDPRQQLANTPPPQSTTPGLHTISIHQMAPPQQTSNCCLLLICRPWKDERLSWPMKHFWSAHVWPVCNNAIIQFYLPQTLANSRLGAVCSSGLRMRQIWGKLLVTVQMFWSCGWRLPALILNTQNPRPVFTQLQ